METNDDLTESSADLEKGGAVNVPELLLGISLIGLGAVLVFRALGSRSPFRPGCPGDARHVPIDITFLPRQGNQITATVTMKESNPNSVVHMTVAYDPPGYVISPAHVCQADIGQNKAEPFTFTVGVIPHGEHLKVTVATVGCSKPVCCSVTKPFPP